VATDIEKIKNSFVIVDGTSYIFRAFYAIKNLTNRDGIPTNAVYGFTSMLLKTIEQLSPKKIIIALDSKGPTFRKEFYNNYKANRPPPPIELKGQIPWIKEVIEALNIKMIEIPGFEADDIIATLVKKLKEKNETTVIISSDKDLMQLIDDNTFMYDSMRDKLFSAKEVKDKFGVGPEKIEELLTLSGDSVDNIPGIPGVGPKTAAKFLNEFGSIKEIYNNLDQLSERFKNKFMDNKENIEISNYLVKLKYDLNISIDTEETDTIIPNKEKLKEIFEKLNFQKLAENFKINNFDKEIVKNSKEISFNNYKTLFTINEIDNELKECFKTGEISIDLETTSLNAMTAEIVGISFACKEGEGRYIPLTHSYIGVKQQPNLNETINVIKKYLENPDIKIIGQNIKYDMLIFKNYGINIKSVYHDTIIASYILNPERYSHKLDDLSKEYLNHNMISYKEITGTGKKQINFRNVDIDIASKYSAEDSDITLRLSHILEKELKENNMTELFHNIELPLISVLLNMEYKGVLIDTKILGKLSVDFGNELEKLKKKIFDFADGEFNINSPKQLGIILFEKLKLKPRKGKVKTTKTGQYSTNEKILTELAKDYELPRLILRYRSISKLKSTYIDSLPLLINRKTGRIHTTFNQTATATGRLSSSDPNLQNIPIREREGREIRKAFIATNGYKLISADYSQVELRVLAHLSQDENLIELFNKDSDIHRETASKIFDVSPEDVDDDMRRKAKVINFGIVYGMGAHRLSNELNIPHKEAKEYIEKFFTRFPGIKTFMDKIVEDSVKTGFVETILGRKRFIKDINNTNKMVQQQAVRVAVNTPIQGSAADIIKKAMLDIQQFIDTNNIPVNMIIQIHDELLFEIKEEYIEQFLPVIKKKMENVISLRVPLLVDIGLGDNWETAH